MFSGIPSAAFVRSSVRWSGLILLPRYVTHERLKQSGKTDGEYSIAPIDDKLDFGGRRSKVKVTAGRSGGEDIHVDAGASKYILV